MNVRFVGLGVVGMLLLATPLLASATRTGGGVTAVREQVENSMLVRGNIHVEVDGSVSNVVLEQQDKLPSGVVSLVRRAATAWRFEPVEVDGKVVKAIAPMSVRVVARKVEGGNYEVSLRGASFQSYDAADPQDIASLSMPAPQYPPLAAAAGATGNVYLLVKIGRDGKVQDAFAEQVNLTFLSREAEQRRYRDMLAKNAVAAARRWTFRVPSEGEAATLPYWTVRVPVNYSMNSGRPSNADEYGRWTSYVPGPREQAPWRLEGQGAESSPDTLAEGGIYMADRNTGPRLLTPLQGG